MALPQTVALILGSYMLSIIKNIVFRCIRRWFRIFSTDYTPFLPQGPVLVIAPHPDDETIGCGAAIARFCAEGRKVYLLIVTDGSNSTASAVITSSELSVIRRNEALNAAKVLGVSQDNVLFLCYPDNQILSHMKEVSKAIYGHIVQLAPAIIFTSHRFDEHVDHRAIAIIAEQLQEEGKINALMLQYPVWYKTISWPYGVLRCLTTVSAYGRYRHLSVNAFSTKKEEALIQYHSQFENLTGEKCWRFFSAASRKRFCISPELFFEPEEKKKLSIQI